MQRNGEISVTLPYRAALSNASKIVENSREDIRKWKIKYHQNRLIYRDGDTIGKSHIFKVVYLPDTSSQPSVRTHGSQICLYLPINDQLESQKTQNLLAPAIKKALTKEAKLYLPQRLSYLAEQHDFSYKKTRFGTPSSRWGSCSPTGTISLNINLMILDDKIIDYVLIHELCHTKQLNHSTLFWSLVENCLPDYRALRMKLKKQQPI